MTDKSLCHARDGQDYSSSVFLIYICTQAARSELAVLNMLSLLQSVGLELLPAQVKQAEVMAAQQAADADEGGQDQDTSQLGQRLALLKYFLEVSRNSLSWFQP